MGAAALIVLLAAHASVADQASTGGASERRAGGRDAAVPAASKDPLVRARAMYNARHYEQAITAAEQAREAPGRADSADLIAARAYLERFRESAAADDLANARTRLRRVDPQRLGARERLELLVGLGETLYFDDAFGAAADVFNSVLSGTGGLAPDARDRVLDWWTSARDREARTRPDPDRQAMYRQIRARMETELAEHPSSATAVYWLVAAARAQGDVQGAWDAAQAGWVRAPLTSDRGASLRADLDQLVLRTLVPERAKALAQPQEALRQQWEQFKERWGR